MKRIFTATLAAVAASSAFAQSYSDTAQVLSAQPIYERSNVPRQECFDETISSDRRVPSQGYVDAGYQSQQPAPRPSERSVGAGTVIGAIIGGVVGHQFGNSSGGRDRGTAAGAIVGGIVGNQIDNAAPGAPSYAGTPVTGNAGRVDYIPETRTVQRCRTVYDGRDEIAGYNVAYRYQGRDYTTRMAYDPGPTMRVQVNLTPDAGAPRR